MLSIKDQAERISRCSFTFDLARAHEIGGIGRMTIFRQGHLRRPRRCAQAEGVLFPQVAKLSEQFFEQLTCAPCAI